MKNNTVNALKNRLWILLILLLCLALLAGCAKTCGSQTADGKNENVTENSGGSENAPFEEKTPEAINGKSENSGKDGADDGAESIDIAAVITENLFSGPDGSVPPEELRPDNDFSGLFFNDAYVAMILKDENGEMQITIASTAADPAVSE